jgi:hypothetical protein
MANLPKNLGLLSGITGFNAALLVALLCDCPPLIALKKGAVGGLAVLLVVWFCAHVAVGVIRDGLRKGVDQDEIG